MRSRQPSLAPPLPHGMVPTPGRREALGLQWEYIWRLRGHWHCSGSAPSTPECAGAAVGVHLSPRRALGL